MSETTPSKYLSPAETSECLRVTDRTVRNYVARGILPAYRISGSRLVRFRREDVEALLVRIPAVGA